MSITLGRARFLRLMGASTAWFAAPGVGCGVVHALGAWAQGDDLQSRVARTIETYDQQGIHRTGTDVDHASAEWLVAAMRRAGAMATLEPFSLDRVDVADARLEAGGNGIEGLPLFDGGSTDAEGISGALGPATSNAPLVLVRLDVSGIQSEGRAIAELRRSMTARGIVAITSGVHPGLSPTNAVSFKTPYGLPVLQVSSEHGSWLDELARSSQRIRFVAYITRTRTEANNVVASIAGRQPDLAPIVVMTPRSGWWRCASERGGGIACWLETARSAASGSYRRTVMFVASSGHELGHLGLETFLAKRATLLKTAAAWIHLGANIGASGGQPRLQASDDAIEAMAAARLREAGVPVEQRVPRGTVPAGEARNIHVAGGRYISLLGTSPVFHNPSDRWPNAVDAQAVARFARAISDFVKSLAEA